MIGCLPKTLEICGMEYEIDSDYRTGLTILTAFNDEELSTEEQFEVMRRLLYIDAEKMPHEHFKEAYNKAVWFLNCGNSIKSKGSTKRLYDWEQDEQMIFSAINKVAGKEVREAEYIHFWTFISFFNEIGEGMFSTIISIREKKNKGKKLEKYESEFYREHREMVDLKNGYAPDIQKKIEELTEKLK